MRMQRVYGLLASMIMMLALSVSTSAQDASGRTFGIVEGFWVPDLACNLGVRWERIIFDWSQHQPTGPDDWHTLNVDDTWLKTAEACNREVVALLKHTPGWATDGNQSIGVPRGLELPVDDPGNLWANFVRRAADYYGSRGVNHFIIWNEPDIEPGTYGWEFEGTLDDYFQMLKVAYLAAKQVNPSAVIHLAGTTYWHDVNAGRRPFVDRLLERIVADGGAASNNFYFDVVSLHIYFRTDTIAFIVNEHRAMLNRYGLGSKRIWINETNAAPNQDPAWPVQRPVYHVNLDQQAAFLVQAAALSLASGVERVAVYKLYDQGLPGGAESFGILSPADGSPRPGYYAWQMVINQFSGVTSGQIGQTDTTAVVRLNQSNGQQAIVAWARTAADTMIAVTALSDKAYLIDQTGNTVMLDPVNGEFQVPLPAAMCNETDGCAVGGNTFVLVQNSGAGVREILGESSQTVNFN